MVYVSPSVDTTNSLTPTWTLAIINALLPIPGPSSNFKYLSPILNLKYCIFCLLYKITNKIDIKKKGIVQGVSDKMFPQAVRDNIKLVSY